MRSSNMAYERPPRLRGLKWLRTFFLIAQPPLLTRRGLRLIHTFYQFVHSSIHRAYSRTVDVQITWRDDFQIVPCSELR
jgi:hypothetical protein